MALMEYAAAAYGVGGYVYERRDSYRSRKAKKKSSPSRASLEDEIQQLRKKMEQTAAEQQSLTSEPVVEISSRLDAKINEYMKGKKS